MTALERQVQTLAAAVERLTKQNNDLEKQLRQKNAGLNTQEEDQEGTNVERRDREGLEGNNALSKLEQQDTSWPSIIAFYMWHSKLRRKGERIDGHGKW